MHRRRLFQLHANGHRRRLLQLPAALAIDCCSRACCKKTLAEADSASDLLVLEACGLTLADFEKTTYRIGSSGATLQHFGWPPAGLGQGFRLDRLLGPGPIPCALRLLASEMHPRCICTLVHFDAFVPGAPSG